GLGVFRSQAYGLAVVFNRLLVLAEIIVGVAAIEVGFGELGVGFDRAVVFANGFFRLAGLVQLQAGVKSLFGLSGPDSCCHHEKKPRRDKAGSFKIHHWLPSLFCWRNLLLAHQRIQLFFWAWVELERSLKIFLRLIGFFLAKLDHSPVGVNMSVLGIELDGVIIIFNREVELAEQRVGVGAVVISFGVFGIELDGFGI